MSNSLSRHAKKMVRSLRPPIERLHVMHPLSFGLFGLDLAMRKHVRGRRGIFVEAGANDGLAQSNTAYLELYMGWRGLLVEPVPEVAARCRLNRPDSIVAEYALGGLGSDGGTTTMTYANLMSLVAGARGTDEAQRNHVERARQHLRPGDNIRTLTVSTATLSALLDKNGLRNIDLLSLDVEGFEAQVLAGLDMSRHAPKWILVEANDPLAIAAALDSRYRLVEALTGRDLLYRRRD